MRSVESKCVCLPWWRRSRSHKCAIMLRSFSPLSRCSLLLSPRNAFILISDRMESHYPLLFNNYRNESQLEMSLGVVKEEFFRPRGRARKQHERWSWRGLVPPTDDYLRFVGDIQIMLSSSVGCMMKPTNDDELSQGGFVVLRCFHLNFQVGLVISRFEALMKIHLKSEELVMSFELRLEL